MPRKTKEPMRNEEKTKKITTKTEKKVEKSTRKTTTAKKETSSVKKKTTSRTTTAKAKSKSTVAKTTTRKKSTKKSTPPFTILEYYDLPYRYNQTIVKILAQTPSTLFVYWDISDEDRNQYKEQYGETFFEHTRPVLVVHNMTNHYSFEIPINDFANSWYFTVKDAHCQYVIELGRRPSHSVITLPNEYLSITSSNRIETPNDHILLEQLPQVVTFRNVQTNFETNKSINSPSFMGHTQKIYAIYDVYKQIYQNEENTSFDFGNQPTSTFL